jgi:DNA-binding MarR family transcriptional regulator
MIENAEETGTRIRHRLGIVGWPGFAPVPHLLLLHQRALKITSAELNAFLNIFMHWQDASRFPFVHTTTIAKRMGIRHRKAQQLVNSLRKKGMIERIPGVRRKDPKRYDVRPLLLKLEPYAKEWAALKERPVQLPIRTLKEVLTNTGVV